MVARNFQADYQRPVGNGPPRIVALLEYRFLELIGPLAYPPSVVARHFFFTFFLLSLPLFLPLLRRFLPSTMLPWGFRRPSPGRGKITRVRQGRIPRFRLGSVIYSELQRDLSCSLRFLPLSFSLSVVFLLIPPPSSFQFLPTPFSNFFSFSLFLLSSSLGFPSLSTFISSFSQSARSPSCSYFSSSVCISSSPPTSPVHPLFNSRFSPSPSPPPQFFFFPPRGGRQQRGRFRYLYGGEERGGLAEEKPAAPRWNTRRRCAGTRPGNFRNASFESGVIGWVMAGRKRWGWEAKVSLVCGQALRSKVTINPLSAVDSYSASIQWNVSVDYMYLGYV